MVYSTGGHWDSSESEETDQFMDKNIELEESGDYEYVESDSTYSQEGFIPFYDSDDSNSDN